MKDEMHYIRHIRDAILQIDEYLDGVIFEEFTKNAMMRDAVVRQLEIIGEAATKFSDDFRSAHPSIPFTKMISMRNRMIHEYFSVDYDAVWKTCQESLKDLKYDIEVALGE